MLKYKNILVPYDGSDHAREALKQAVDMAQNSEDCTLHVASVCNMVAAVRKSDQASISEGKLTAELAEDSEKEAREALKEAEKLIPQDLPANMIYEIGSPTSTLGNCRKIQLRFNSYGIKRIGTYKRNIYGIGIKLLGKSCKSTGMHSKIMKGNRKKRFLFCK